MTPSTHPASSRPEADPPESSPVGWFPLTAATPLPEPPPHHDPLPLSPPPSLRATRPPTLDELAVFANRWLKGSCPPHTQRTELIRLLARCQRNTAVNPTSIACPWPRSATADLAQQVADLWQQTLGLPDDHPIQGEDVAVTWLWLWSHLHQCQPAYWCNALTEDATTFGVGSKANSTPGHFPEFPLQGTVGSQRLQQLAQGYLHRPFPWRALIERLNADQPAWRQRTDWLGWIDTALNALQTCPPPPLAAPLGDWLAWVRACPLPASTRGRVHPARLLVLVEGISDALLLPALGLCDGLDFEAQGIRLQPLGGKNKIADVYSQWAPWLRPPILLVLDADAHDEWKPWADQALRPGDQCFFWPSGELEDAYPLSWLTAFIAETAIPHLSLGNEDILAFFADTGHEVAPANPPGNAARLAAFWQQHQLGSFDKAAFARDLARWLEQNRPPLSGSMTALMGEVRRLLAAAPTSQEVWEDVVGH